MLIKKFFEETYRSKITCYITSLASLFILAGMVVTVQKPLVYDEPIYQQTVETLKQYGFSISFLNNMKVTTGPLYTILHNSLAPLTNLDVPGVRLVNVTLLCLTIITTSGIGYLNKLSSPLLSALCMISIPMTWVMSGMALTEMPAIFFMSVALFLLFWSTSSSNSEETDNHNVSFVSPRQLVIAILGGIIMGIAITGRQPLLVTLAAVPILAINSRSRMQALCFLLSAAILPIILFSIWGGLTPPLWQERMASYGGFSIKHLILAYCYAGGISLILAPKFFSINWKPTVIIVAVSILINGIFSWIEFVPMRTLSNQIIPATIFPIYTKIVSGLLVSLGVLYIASVFKNLFENRKNLNYLFLGVATLFICFTTLKVTVQFSSRYVAQALPLFILITAPYTEASYFKATRIVLGSLLGVAILTSYYFS
jgi:4-amino-4-deoxy-L-arabinose transferase-like glycosyltransferase